MCSSYILFCSGKRADGKDGLECRLRISTFVTVLIEMWKLLCMSFFTPLLLGGRGDENDGLECRLCIYNFVSVLKLLIEQMWKLLCMSFFTPLLLGGTGRMVENVVFVLFCQCFFFYSEISFRWKRRREGWWTIWWGRSWNCSKR